jgi:hypothetical protein
VPLKLTDTLDQVLRMLLATGKAPSAEPRYPEPAQPDAPREQPAASTAAVPTTEASVAKPEAAPPTPEPTRPSSDLARLETAADVAEKLGLGFHLGSAVERIAIAAGEGSQGQPRLREAAWLIERYLELLEQRPVGADIHQTMMRLARQGDTIAGLQALATALEASPAVAEDDEHAALPNPGAPPTQLPLESPAEHNPPEHRHGPHVVVEQPSIRRELFLTSMRAVIATAAIVGVVFLLTLIAQWR